MRAAGEASANPLKESFTFPGNRKRLLVALFGVAAGLTVIWYTALFSTLTFLSDPKGSIKMDQTAAQLIVGAGATVGLVFYFLTGKLSDRVGRKPPIVWGYAATLVLLFPFFKLIGWGAGNGANPAGWVPGVGEIVVIEAGIIGMMALSGLTYGGVAALLAEMFPPRIRYSSLSIPYHFGTGYFGGFLPLISAAVVARTGDAYAGLWYTEAVVAMALAVAWWGLDQFPSSSEEGKGVPQARKGEEVAARH